jgi:hypothetical protein
MKKIYLLLFSSVVLGQLFAQSSNVPLNSPSQELLERLEVLSGQPSGIHTDIAHSIRRKHLIRYANHLDSVGGALNVGDRWQIEYLLRDNQVLIPDSLLPVKSPKSRLQRYIYRNGTDLFSLKRKYFTLAINPILQLAWGREQNNSSSMFYNRRGVELRGDIDGKVWFSTNLVEQQLRFPTYITERVNQYFAIPGAAIYKNYTSRVLDINDGFDYNVAQAAIGFNATKHIDIELGHGSQFIGNGYRSLFQSDFGTNAFYLKFNTRIWKFHYQNLFQELTPYSYGNAPQAGAEPHPKKFTASHYLSYQVTPRFSVGLLETTVFHRSRQFEFQYLNPVVLYRTVEGAFGSSDNVLIGINTHFDLFKHVRVYGQLMMDEFVFKYLIRPEVPGWWGNKYGVQAGVKYFNALGINNLDVQLEFNSVRPYTYTHFDSLNNWTHYGQSLAHPLGANFREYVALLRYQPTPRLIIRARTLLMETGDDRTGDNWGGNILLDYDTREQEFNNETGQGVSASTLILGLDASWELFHNCYFDVNVVSRRKNSTDAQFDRNATLFTAGIRLNFWAKPLDF